MKRTEILTALMGLIIALTGTYFLVTRYFMEGEWEYTDLASYIILIVGGAIVTLFCRKDIRKGIIAALLTIGISTIVDYSYYFLFSDDIVFVAFSNVYLIVSVVLIYYAISLMFHTSAGSIKGIVCLGILALFEFFPTLYLIYMGGEPLTLVEENLDMIAYGVMHITVVLILSRKDMLLETLSKRIDRNSKCVYGNACTPADAYIDRPDLSILLDGTDTGWEYFDSGPIECERPIRLYRTDMELRLQRWKNDDRMHISVCTAGSDSYKVILSMPVQSMVLDTDDRSTAERVRFYGYDGVLMDILVRNYEDEKKGYIETMRFNRKRKKMKKAQMKKKLS